MLWSSINFIENRCTLMKLFKIDSAAIDASVQNSGTVYTLGAYNIIIIFLSVFQRVSDSIINMVLQNISIRFDRTLLRAQVNVKKKKYLVRRTCVDENETIRLKK